MTKPSIRAILFCMDQSFGKIVRENVEVTELRPFRATYTLLDETSGQGAPAALLYGSPLSAASRAEIAGRFPHLELFTDPDFPGGLERFVQERGLAPEQTILVSADRVLRGRAAKLGLHPVPHPKLVDGVRLGQSLGLYRVIAARRVAGDIREIPVPVSVRQILGLPGLELLFPPAIGFGLGLDSGLRATDVVGVHLEAENLKLLDGTDQIDGVVLRIAPHDVLAGVLWNSVPSRLASCRTIHPLGTQRQRPFLAVAQERLALRPKEPAKLPQVLCR